MARGHPRPLMIAPTPSPNCWLAFALALCLTACGPSTDGDPIMSKPLVPSDTVDAFIGSECMDLEPPAVIKESGCYRVVKDYKVSANGDFGITVLAPHVKLDLNGHTLTGSGPASTAAGVHAIGVNRITIENGNLRNFLYGVRVDPLEQTQTTEATLRSLHIADGTARGIFVTAQNTTIEGSLIENLSGFTGWPASHTIGIEVVATNCRIVDNHIVNYLPEGLGEAVGISLSSAADNCSVLYNQIETPEPAAFGRTIGVWISSEQKNREFDAVLLSQNAVVGADYAFLSSEKPQFERNHFAIACGPNVVTAYDAHLEGNEFAPLAAPCGDTLEALVPLAATDPRWQVRLAAALHERLWIGASPETACDDLRRSKALLLPLVAQGMAGAQEQLVRVNPLAARCT